MNYRRQVIRMQRGSRPRESYSPSVRRQWGCGNRINAPQGRPMRYRGEADSSAGWIFALNRMIPSSKHVMTISVRKLSAW